MPIMAAAASTHAPMEEIMISVPLDGSSASSREGKVRKLEMERDYIFIKLKILNEHYNDRGKA